MDRDERAERAVNMSTIESLGVLVVDDDEDGRSLIEMFLTRSGAKVREAGSASEARATLSAWRPDVILADVGLPGEDGFCFVARLRDDPATASIPAIAITGFTDNASRTRALEAGFRKVLTKPLDVFSLPAAISSVIPTSEQPADEPKSSRVARWIARRDMRSLLRDLNASTLYRYTSILRFDADRLESVWTFDRTEQRSDAFPETPIEASYCSFIRNEGVPFAMSDSLTDPRVADHPARTRLRSYCGVPLLREDGTFFGSLCHYDQEPKALDATTVEDMDHVAKLLAPVLSREGERMGRRSPTPSV